MKINEKEYKKTIKENGGLYGIIATAIREHGLEKIENIILGPKGQQYETTRATALSLFLDSRMHANQTLKEILHLKK